MAENAIAVQEKPILFSGAMVRAVIEGRKTQTRRLVKPQPETRGDVLAWGIHLSGLSTDVNMRLHLPTYCPYGNTGTLLWVRETHYRWGHWEKSGKTDKGAQRWKFIALDKRVVFAATDTSKESPTHRGDDGWWKRPAIFLPRWASRLTLEIVRVKVERVQDISEADAIAEGAAMLDSGLECSQCSWTGYEDSNGVQFVEIGNEDSEFHCPECQEVCAHHPIDEQCRWGFHRLWDSINAKRDGGKYAWEKNPWVWAIEFKAVK